MSVSPVDRIREMIITGQLLPGERVIEADLAKRLGVSRTPIREALPLLEADGYLEVVGKRGFAVKRFDSNEAYAAMELRAVLEGVAAKYLAQNGASRETIDGLRECLETGDRIFAKRYLTTEDEFRYGEMNSKFHSLVVENCGSKPLIQFVEKLNNMPFTNPSVVVFDHLDLTQAYDELFWAHGQHHDLTRAIQDRDAARAEAIFREHGFSHRHGIAKLSWLL